MAYKPRYKKRGSNMRKRLQFGSRMYKRGAKLKQPVQYFTRTAYFNNLFTVGTTASAPAVAQFRLSDVPNNSEFTTLYDQYQIKAVKYTIIPKFTNQELIIGSGAAAAILGNVWSVIDYDDLTPPIGVDQLLQYQNVKRTRADKVHKRYLKPKVRIGITDTAGTVVNNMAKKNCWLDCSNTTTPHFGLKLWFDALAGITNTNVSFDVVVKYYMAFKNVR